MTGIDWMLQQIKQSGIIAAIRCRAPLDLMLEVGDALHATPITAVMISPGSRQPWAIVAELRHRYGASMLVGTGQLAATDQAVAAIDAGAQFVMSSHYRAEIDHLCRRRGALYLPGVRTACAARQLLAIGVCAVNFFPAHCLERAELLQIAQSETQLCVVAMGGVAGQNLRAYAQAGAAAVVVRGVLGAAAHWRMRAAIVEMRRLRALWAIA